MSIQTQPADNTQTADDLLSQFPALTFGDSRPISAIQIPIRCDDGSSRVLTVCPHVVKALKRLELDLYAAHSALEWIVEPEKRYDMVAGTYGERPAVPHIGETYLNDLVENVEDHHYRTISFRADENGANLFFALTTLLRQLRHGRKDGERADWEIEGLPNEVHAETDASCCAGRHAIHLAAVAQREREKVGNLSGTLLSDGSVLID